MTPTEPEKPFKSGVIYGIAEEWYQSPEGRKLIAEIHAHNEDILDRLFGPDAFLPYDPELDDGPIEISSCTLEPYIPLTDNEPLLANPITKGDS